MALLSLSLHLAWYTIQAQVEANGFYCYVPEYGVNHYKYGSADEYSVYKGDCYNEFEGFDDDGAYHSIFQTWA